MPLIDTDDLETKCYVCGGSGWVKKPDLSSDVTTDYEETCSKCEGKGTLLTATGKILMSIIRRHL